MSLTQQRLMPSEAGVELSREEFLEGEFDPQWRYERAEGKLVVMPRHEFGHHVTTMPFRDHLGAYMLAHLDSVEFVFQESHAVIDDDTDRIPDIAVYLKSDRELPEFPYRART
ncbi:MAG: Uma2 family endonuclease [Planctomycetaceae bacterium]